VRIEATAEVTGFIRDRGGRVFVWIQPMAYGSGRVFVLEASTDSPGPEREFRRFRTDEGIEVLFDADGRALPERLLLAVKGWRRKRIRAYWNGNSFAQG